MNVIDSYSHTFVPISTQQDNLLLAVRFFSIKSHRYYLTVNPYTLDTAIQRPDQISYCPPQKRSDSNSIYFSWNTLKKTPYISSLIACNTPPVHLENYGLTRASHKIDGMILTIDLCPSAKPFEKKFFQTLVALANDNCSPMPIAISISGAWLLEHSEEFNWLIEQSKQKKLAITWINHSLSHLHFAEPEFGENFMVFPYIQTSFHNEILQLEKLLIEHKQLPSIFFRFPGLVSDKGLITALGQFHLIPVGTDAWLAHNEKPHSGSIILVHGNGNEPEGIDKVMPYLLDRKNNWLPLANALACSVDKKGRSQIT